MTFSDTQLRNLKAPLRRHHIKERQADGKTLHYIEGWHVVAEANRIFGFDAWDRETIGSQCVWQKQIDHRFGAAYLTRVRISVRAGDTIVFREGLGSGESISASSGQAHERASKAAETDATKRALSTFGNSFGLSLYGGKIDVPKPKTAAPKPPEKPATNRQAALLPVYLPPPEVMHTMHIEKSELALPEPKRLRDREHLKFVASQPCLVCGRAPSQAHHLRFTQPRALGRKVSDEFTVPLCPSHHHELHMRGNELAWWQDKRIEPSAIAEDLWQLSRFGDADISPRELAETKGAAGSATL